MAIADQVDQFTLGGLLCRITQQTDTMLFINNLGKPGAIEAQISFSSP